MAHGAAHEPALNREPDAQVLGFGNDRCLGIHRFRAAPCFGVDQRFGIVVLRIGKDLGGWARLDDLTPFHHADPVGDPTHDAKVMGDEKQAHAFALFQLHQQVEDLCLNGDVQCGGGFIRDQQVRPICKRHGDHHPLALTAGQLVRIVGQAPFSIADPHLVQQVEDAQARVLSAQPLMQFQAFRQLFFDCVQRIERGHRLLKNETDIVAAHIPEICQ